MLTEQQTVTLYERHVAMVYRVCFAYMKSSSQTEDAVQETFIRAMTKAPSFDGRTHEQAWLLRVATNVCKDMLKTWWRKRISLDNSADVAVNDHVDATLLAVLALPDKYKVAVYLFYYEGYATAEIAQMCGRAESTVRNDLSRARRLLRTQLGGDFDA